MNPRGELPGLSDSEYERFRALVRTTSGIDVVPSRRPELERVVDRTTAELALPGHDALYRLLMAEPRGGTLLETLIAQLTIGETYFFRNRPQFEALEQHILPGLIEQRRETRTLRLWSAGCSTGEEAYSLSILLHRLLPDLAGWRILILATDINRTALERARRGIYGNWSFRDGATALQPLYFTSRGQLFEIGENVRRLVRFEYLNLVDAQYPSPATDSYAMDLILCRNVLIYFDEESTRKVIGRLYEALAPEGWLLVGHAEPSAANFPQFAAHNFPGTIIYRKAPPIAQAPAPAALLLPWAELLPAAASPPRSAGVGRAQSPPSPALPEIAPIQDSDAALQLWEHGKPQEAIALLEDIAAAQPADAGAPYLLAKLHADRMQLAEAETWIELALQRGPLLAQSHYLRGLILQASDRHWEALEAFRGCAYADPGFVLAHVALADQFAKLGQPQRARKAMENVVQLLAGRPRDESIAGGDGLTVGRLLDLAAAGRQPSHEQR